MRRIVVLGGSSPFTAALVDAFEGAGRSLPGCRLVLHGRNDGRLERVRNYADARLRARGWRCEHATNLGRALSGAWVVLNQIRFGGLSGRAEDEDLALRFGQWPDETLGLGALNRVLHGAASLLQLGRRLRAECPDAWVLNLTNPLSLTTSILTDAGIARCVGLCELPLITAEESARRLGIPLEHLTWCYVGLNHRGFIVSLELDGVDQIELLARAVGESAFAGVPSVRLRDLGAIPTKYFRLLTDRSAPRGGRAAQLEAIGNRVWSELDAAPGQSPASLTDRYTEWYPRSVVPLVVSLLSDRPVDQVINVTDESGLTRELHARVSSNRIEPVRPVEVNDEVQRWIGRFERHERAMLSAVRSPSPETILEAVRLDPLPLASDRLEAANDALCAIHVEGYFDRARGAPGE